MTKAELIKALEEYPDDIEIRGWGYNDRQELEYFELTVSRNLFQENEDFVTIC